jgi:Domain of unknown function (DUF4386)
MNWTGLRWTAVGIGVLFWISNLVTLAGGVIAGAVPTGAGEVSGMYPHASQIVAGTLIAHVNDFAIIGYAVLLYPVLARFHPSVALGYAAFKVVEAVMLLVAAATLLSVIALSHDQQVAGGSDPAGFQASAAMALSQQFWAGRLAAFAYVVATPVLNLALYRTRLVPRWLSGWGLAACAMLAAGLALGVGDPTRGFEPGQLLLIPIIVWELTFATWLIVRGFSLSRATDPRDVAYSSSGRFQSWPST